MTILERMKANHQRLSFDKRGNFYYLFGKICEDFLNFDITCPEDESVQYELSLLKAEHDNVFSFGKACENFLFEVEKKDNSDPISPVNTHVYRAVKMALSQVIGAFETVRHENIMDIIQKTKSA